MLPGDEPLPFFIIFHLYGIARVSLGKVFEEGEGNRY